MTWGEQLSEALDKLECTPGERQELREWLAQEIPDRWAPAKEVIEWMLDAYREDL